MLAVPFSIEAPRNELKLKPPGLPFINADQIAKEVYPDDPEGNSYKITLSDIQVRHRQGVFLDKLTTRFYLVTHQGGKYLVGGNGIFDSNF